MTAVGTATMGKGKTMTIGDESGVRPFSVSGTDATHVIIELFGGDNNLSDYVMEDLQEMAAGNRGSFAVIGLVDLAGEPLDARCQGGNDDAGLAGAGAPRSQCPDEGVAVGLGVGENEDAASQYQLPPEGTHTPRRPHRGPP